MADYLVDIAAVSQVFEEEEDMLQAMNEELDKEIAIDLEKIETYVIPDSPVKDPVDQDMDEDENTFTSMNAELDKQIAQDMEAIKTYISKTDESISTRIQFFNNMDNSHINKCIDKTVTNHILYQHTVLGTIIWHECNQCEFRAKEKEKLRDHMIQKHSTVATLFACHRCSFVSKTNGDLLRHLRMVHQENKEESFPCGQCDAVFEKHYHLLRHMKGKHDFVAFICEKCDFASVDQSELRQHVLAEHLRLNVSWYKCAQCAYRTAKKINLDRHIMYKHTFF